MNLTPFNFSDPLEGIKSDSIFDFGVVVGSEKITDPSHPSYGEGNTFTGLYTISCLSRCKTYQHVSCMYPALGAGGQQGGIHPPGTMVLICYVTPQKKPVILGAVSYNYLFLREEGRLNTQEVNPEERSSELLPGEQILQAAIKNTRESEGERKIQYMGGYVKADSQGGVKIVTRKDGDFVLVHGDPDDTTSKQTRVTIVGERDADAEVQLEHSSGTKIIISPTGAVTIENVKTKTEHTAGDHIQNDDSNFLITVQGNTILTCDNVQLGADGGEKVLQGETFRERHNIHTHMGNLGYPTGPPSYPSTEVDLSDKVHTKK